MGSIPRGGPALATGQVPADVVAYKQDIFVSDAANNVIWKINTSSGYETVFAGNGTAGHAGDGGPAQAAELNHPAGMAIDAAGDLFIADAGNNRVREVTSSDGHIHVIAGSGITGFGGDGGKAVKAKLYYPSAVACRGHKLYIADSFNNRVRVVDMRTGLITTVAGDGTHGDSGDGGPAT
ncbi:MAG TPA: hypothetical protein VMU77_00945, partial [Acidimicrobiales bacterium]|nr:hypothetical protein [Acidimicrobiales bacterium]